jgi:hypothetical protein
LIKLSKQLQNNLLIYFLTVHSKTNLNQSADSNDYNAPKKIGVTDPILKIWENVIFLYKLSPHIKYEISITMKYLIQTKMSLLILSNLSPINFIRSFWKQSFNLIQKLCIVFQRYIKEFNEDIKLRYIVVLGDGWDDASILCIWLKWNCRRWIFYMFLYENKVISK